MLLVDVDSVITSRDFMFMDPVSCNLDLTDSGRTDDRSDGSVPVPSSCPVDDNLKFQSRVGNNGI